MTMSDADADVFGALWSEADDVDGATWSEADDADGVTWSGSEADDADGADTCVPPIVVRRQSHVLSQAYGITAKEYRNLRKNKAPQVLWTILWLLALHRPLSATDTGVHGIEQLHFAFGYRLCASAWGQWRCLSLS